MNKLIFAGLLGLSMVGNAEARPRKESMVTLTARNDGDRNEQFAVGCSSTAWTVVGSSLTTLGTGTGPSRVRRRAMTIQMLSSATYAICLSSTSVVGDTCSDTRAGYELGTAWGSVSIYDEAAWYCRVRTGTNSTIYLKGAEHYDSRDEATAR